MGGGASTEAGARYRSIRRGVSGLNAGLGKQFDPQLFLSSWQFPRLGPKRAAAPEYLERQRFLEELDEESHKS